MKLAATSGGSPPLIALVILSSSWPFTVLTVMFGWAVWKRATAALNAFTSFEPVNPCQTVIVCLASGAGPFFSFDEPPAVHADSARSAAVAAAAPAANRPHVFVIRFS